MRDTGECDQGIADQRDPGQQQRRRPVPRDQRRRVGGAPRRLAQRRDRSRTWRASRSCTRRGSCRRSRPATGDQPAVRSPHRQGQGDLRTTTAESSTRRSSRRTGSRDRARLRYRSRRPRPSAATGRPLNCNRTKAEKRENFFRKTKCLPFSALAPVRSSEVAVVRKQTTNSRPEIASPVCRASSC